MYEIADYTSVNNLGTAVLLEGVLKQKNIQRMVVASSMSIYGEGLYKDSKVAYALPPIEHFSRSRRRIGRSETRKAKP